MPSRYSILKGTFEILDHLNPTDPIFFNGFPTLDTYLRESQFHDVMQYKKQGEFSVGTIAGRFKFIGLPFLTRVALGNEALVARIKSYLQ